MFAKMNRHRFISFLLLVLFCFVAYKGYEWYRYGDFKRAYEHGTVYEQLDTLMNGTRYVEAVRKAGYVIDDYNLMMTERIASLTTKGEPTMEISSPTSGTFIVKYTYAFPDKTISVFQEYDKKLVIKNPKFAYSTYDKLEGRDWLNLPMDRKILLNKTSKTEIKWMLKDIYESMYPKEEK